jgi:hypothetical protein
MRRANYWLDLLTTSEEEKKMNEEIILKMNLLGGMNTYIREVIGDEDLIDEWDMYGVPNEASEDDLQICAYVAFAEICAKFGQLVCLAEKEG